MIKRFKEALKNYQHSQTQPYIISMSIGITTFDPQNPCSIDLLLSEADKMMYQNKLKMIGMF